MNILLYYDMAGVMGAKKAVSYEQLSPKQLEVTREHAGYS